MKSLGKRGIENSKCKGTGAAKSLECLKNSDKPVWLIRKKNVQI